MPPSKSSPVGSRNGPATPTSAAGWPRCCSMAHGWTRRGALELNPRYLEARLLAARVELEAGDGEAAESQLAHALSTHAQYPDLWFWLGVARFRSGDLAGGRERTRLNSRHGYHSE